MILNLLFVAIISILGFLTAWLPSGLTLPFGLDTIFQTTFSYLYAFIEIFPPMGIVLQAFIVYLGFRIGLMILKVFLGSRSPSLN